MYILVEIIHTEFQYISLIEMQKYNWNRKRIEKRKTWKKRNLLSRLVTPTGTKGCASHVGAGCTFCPGWCYQPGQKVLFCPGCHTRDKRAPPFVPDRRSRLGNRDNSGFPTGTNQRFCSSECTSTTLKKNFRVLVIEIPWTEPTLLTLQSDKFNAGAYRKSLVILTIIC